MALTGDDINIAEGVAYCRACGTLSRLRDIAHIGEGDDGSHFVLPDVDLANPPAGCATHDDGIETRIVSSCRSTSGILGTLFLCGFWNGIVSIFVLLAIAETLTLLLGRAPSWFPAPSNSSGGMTGGSIGGVIFLWLFLTPFICIGASIFFGLLTVTFGRCEVKLRGDEGTIFTGMGAIGWRRKFSAQRVRSVRIGQTTWEKNDERQPCICIEIEAGKPQRLASLVTSSRRDWMVCALHRLLIAHR